MTNRCLRCGGRRRELKTKARHKTDSIGGPISSHLISRVLGPLMAIVKQKRGEDIKGGTRNDFISIFSSSF